MKTHPPETGSVQQAHELYCRLTGQALPLRYDRERMWFEVLRAGHSLEDIEHLIRYLQREIRASRRQVGALKLSNLLQPDRFEEDLAISRLRLSAPPRPRHTPPPDPRPKPAPISEAERERRRLRGLELVAELRRKIE
jgi:hypothetical protein